MNRKVRRTLEALRVKKSARPEGEVRQEYLNKCAQAGELQYRIEQLETSLSELNREIQALNLEYSSILEDKKSEKANEAPVTTTETK